MTDTINRKKLTDIKTHAATLCPINGRMALDGWTWDKGQNVHEGEQHALLCSKWRCGSCNECSGGLQLMTETKR